MNRRPICSAPCEVHELRQAVVPAVLPLTYSVIFCATVSNVAVRCVQRPDSATGPYRFQEPSDSTSVTGVDTVHLPVFGTKPSWKRGSPEPSCETTVW